MSQPPNRKTPEAEGAEREANKEQDRPHRLVPDGPTGAQPPPTIAGHEPAPQEPHNGRKTVQFWAELIGLAVLMLYTYFAGRQWGELSTQTDHLIREANRSVVESMGNAARVERQLRIAGEQVTEAQKNTAAIARQMRQDQRPWVTFNVGDDPKGEIAAHWKIKVEGPLTVPVTFANIGKTPAMNVESIILIDIVPNGEEPHLARNFILGKDAPRGYRTGAAVDVGTGVIFPGGHIKDSANRVERRHGKIVDKILSVTEANNFFRKNAYLVVYGEVRYIDVFGMKHWTRFCSDNFADGESAHSVKCADYAAADNNT